MSKILLRDDDVIEILDFLVYQVLTNENLEQGMKADYLADKLCSMSRRDYLEYVDIVKKERKII